MANVLSFLRQIEGAAKPDDLYHFARKLVGVDAHIDPAVRTVFTEICGEPALFFVIDDRFYSVGTHIRVYLKTPNAPGQRTFSRCAAPFFLEIRQYSCEKMSCSAQKFLAAGHIGSFQIHPKNEMKDCPDTPRVFSR